MRILLAMAALLTVAAAKPVNWARTVTKTSAGAYVLGNPKAPVRIVEYMSYTCPHCAHFEEEGAPKLVSGYVARGTVAFEIRNAVRDQLDFTAALAARCGGPARFFGNHAAIFAGQEAIFTAANAFAAAQGSTLQGDPNAGLKAMARGSGLGAVMAKRGVPAAALDACLTSPAEQRPVLAMTREAWQERKIPGTPAFFINGEAAAPGGWDILEPQIRAALAPRPKAG